jgi:hypothetical protein
MTFVSSRNFTDRPGANLVGAAGKDACEDFVGKFRAKDVESSSHLWIHHGFGEGGSKRLGLLGPAAQRLGQRPDQAGILLGRLNLNAHKTSRRRATIRRHPRDRAPTSPSSYTL